MKNAIRNLLLTAAVLFSASFDSCTAGVEYDRRHEIYGEPNGFTCTFGGKIDKVYGRRWERLGLFTFTLGSTLCFTAFAIRRRRRHSEELRCSIIPAE